MSLNCSSLMKFYEHRLLSPWLPTLACEPVSWLINQLWAPRRAGQVQAGRNVTSSIPATCRSWPVVGTIYGTFRHKLSFPVVGTNILRQNIWPWHKLSCPIVGTNITRQSIWPRHKLCLTVVGTIYRGRIYRLGTRIGERRNFQRASGEAAADRRSFTLGVSWERGAGERGAM